MVDEDPMCDIDGDAKEKREYGEQALRNFGDINEQNSELEGEQGSGETAHSEDAVETSAEEGTI
jgi:hypothetical protein